MSIKLIVDKILRIPSKLKLMFYIRYNRFLFWIKDVKVGSNMRVYNKLYLIKGKNSTIRIGDNFVFSSGDCFNPLCRNIRGCINAKPGASIVIGSNTGISSACLWAKESITIGDHVNIGGDTIIMDTDAHSLDYNLRRSKEILENKMSLDSFSAASAPIVIEDDVLIGTRCIVLKGVTIGARSIIGSGSIVTKSIPADCIAAGNPCRVIKRIE